MDARTRPIKDERKVHEMAPPLGRGAAQAPCLLCTQLGRQAFKEPWDDRRLGLWDGALLCVPDAHL